MAAPIHTHYAMAAIDLAGLFNAIVGGEPVPATTGPAFEVELAAPDGPSTGGGAQSRQHIRLQREGTTLVAGAFDSVQKEAELRSYDHVAALYAQRYKGARPPVDRVAYDACLRRIKEFASQQGMTIVLRDPAVSSAAPVGSSSTATLALALGLVVVVAAAAYFLMMR